MAVAKRRAPRARKLTGIAGAPLTVGFEAFKYYFHYEVDRKDVIKLLHTYVRKTYPKARAQAILAVPDYKFAVVCHMAAAIRWMELGHNFAGTPYEGFPAAIEIYFNELEAEGKEILKAKKDEEKATKLVPTLSPQQRIIMKVNDTIMHDLDELEDQWLEHKEVKSFDVYTKLVSYDLKGPVPVRMVKDWCQHNIDDLEDGEGFEHLKAAERKRRIKLLKQMIEDVDRFAAAQKATRKPRAKKPKAADAKVKSLKYMPESVDFKLRSINPVSIPNSVRLYTFNTRTRELTEYIAIGADGLDVKGTSILNYDEKTSRRIKLRKPDDVLPDILSKTPRQIDNIIEKQSTKANTARGRIGADVILLRTLNK